jgi:arsenate reductase
MGEGLLRHAAGDRFEVYSAGLEPKGMNPFTIQAMDEIGVDVRSQWSKSVKEYMGRIFFHYVITVCGDADESCPQALWANGGIKLHFPFEDPAALVGTDEEKLALFRRVRDEIDARLQRWLTELDTEAAHA